VLGKAAAFVAVALTLGVPITRRLFTMVAHLRHPGIVVGSALVFCLGVSFLAEWVGLAAIVGAFVAGLVLEEAHLRPFGEARPLGELIEPLTAFLGPVFFAVMGMRTDLAALGSSHALAMGALLLVAAIAGKAACAIGVGRGVDRVAVVLGLLARGEVTLVFANLGLGLGVFDAGVFAALMLVVLATVLVTPPALTWRLRATQPAEPTRPSPS
jgi:Kef-type K+ transport system membrane component KefB